MLLERRWLPRSHRRYTAMQSNSTIDFPRQLKSQLMFRTEIPVVTLLELGHIRASNVKVRKYRKNHGTPQRMLHDDGQRNPVVSIQPWAVGGARRRMRISRLDRQQIARRIAVKTLDPVGVGIDDQVRDHPYCWKSRRFSFRSRSAVEGCRDTETTRYWEDTNIPDEENHSSLAYLRHHWPAWWTNRGTTAKRPAAFPANWSHRRGRVETRDRLRQGLPCIRRSDRLVCIANSPPSTYRRDLLASLFICKESTVATVGAQDNVELWKLQKSAQTGQQVRAIGCGRLDTAGELLAALAIWTVVRKMSHAGKLRYGVRFVRRYLRRRINMIKSTTDPNSKPPRLPSYVAIMYVVRGNIAVSATTVSQIPSLAQPPPVDVALRVIATGPSTHNPTHTAKGEVATGFAILANTPLTKRNLTD
jgi:hypothetical protein